MLRKVLAIAGKPGLYKLVSRGNNSLIIETLDDKHKRMPAFGADKIIALADIAMYTDEEEVPLAKVMQNIQDELGKDVLIDINPKKASNQELADFMAKALPNYDREHVYPGDMKKLIQWYNLLVQNGINDFSLEEAEESETTEEA
ncbi:MAG: DUF5606 domain-containing protein [Bacteroidaceae bacterium]|nr:DUF5606 domain-containing protein [Prevotellaceae bacterium]MDY5632485.1 DUF5606 domain-containing protein [Bacteroidaceae bacterium]